MALLRTNLLIFAVLTNDKFLIYRNSQVSEAFVCFNEYNSTWPDNWIRLSPLIQDDLSVFQTINVPKNNTAVLKYKVRFVYSNRTYEDSQWKLVLNNTFFDYNNKVSDLYKTNSTSYPELETYYKINILFTLITITTLLQVVIFIRSTCILNSCNITKPNLLK